LYSTPSIKINIDGIDVIEYYADEFPYSYTRAKKTSDLELVYWKPQSYYRIFNYVGSRNHENQFDIFIKNTDTDSTLILLYLEMLRPSPTKIYAP
jgi:hypothetical protein